MKCCYILEHNLEYAIGRINYMAIRTVQFLVTLLLSSDWRSYKLCLCLWVRGQWRNHYGSNISISESR